MLSNLVLRKGEVSLVEADVGVFLVANCSAVVVSVCAVVMGVRVRSSKDTSSFVLNSDLGLWHPR